MDTTPETSCKSPLEFSMTAVNSRLIRDSTAELLIFTNQAGEQSIEARYEDETVWLTQKLMAELFAVDVRTVSEHLGNIFSSGELAEDSVVRIFRRTAADGMAYAPQQYNLDAIFSVGYRVNSLRATQLRRWSTGVLRERANAAQPHMGLTSWDKAPDGKIVKTDVVIAKNCLSRDERASPPRQRLPRRGRGHGAAQDSHDHAGLGNPSEPLHRSHRPRGAAGRRQGHCRNRPGACRERIREMPHRAGPAV
jgi:hypothetical protein